jgi:5-methylcytosine-specific restriction endonuclease McrA
MPIRQENLARYPADWKAISRAIRERAGQRCQECEAENGKPHPITGSKVVLTVAHLDHQPENNHPSNLRAWCQRCHLAYDAAHHARNAAVTRRKRMNTAELFEAKMPVRA